MVWVPWCQQQGVLISHVIGVFLWHPQSSAVYAISSWMCWLIPQKEKVQAGAKQLQTQVWAHLAAVPGAVHPHAVPPPRGDRNPPGSLQSGVPGPWCDRGTKLRTTPWHSLSQTQCLGHITQQGMEDRQQGMLRDTDREKSLSPGISAHSLPQQEHRRSCPSRDELKSSLCAGFSGLWPAGTVTDCPSQQPRCLALTPALAASAGDSVSLPPSPTVPTRCSRGGREPVPFLLSGPGPRLPHGPGSRLPHGPGTGALAAVPAPPSPPERQLGVM